MTRITYGGQVRARAEILGDLSTIAFAPVTPPSHVAFDLKRISA